MTDQRTTVRPRPSRAVVLATLLLGLLPVASAQEIPAELRAPFEEGVRALREGRLDDAEATFRSVIEKGGNGAQVHNNLGIVYQMRGEHARAVGEFREAARIDPEYPAPQILLGASLLALGEVDEARARLEAVVQLAPEAPLAHLQLARALEVGGDWGAAAEQYKTLRRLVPEDPEYLYGLGQAYLRLSEACLRRLHALHPDSARSHQARAHAYRLQGRTDLALRAFEEAAQADPSLPEIHLAMAQIHAEEGRWAEARREIAREREVVPESAGALALERYLRGREGASP